MISEQNFLNLEGLRYFKEKILDTTSTLISETFNQMLPITGGYLRGTLKISTDGGNRNILIGGTSNNIKFIQSNPNNDWGTGMLMRDSSDTTTLGAYGFRYGTGDILRYYYIGSNSDTPVFKMTPDGTITLTKALPIESGGTGSATKTGARENLGIKSGTSLPSTGTVGDIFLLHS